MKKRILSIALALSLAIVFVPAASALDYVEIVPPRYDAVGIFSEGMAAVRIGYKWGYVDKSGNLVISLEYSQAGIFREGLVNVSTGVGEALRYGYVDKSGNMVVPPKYWMADSFSEGLALVLIGEGSTGKYGYIDNTGKEVIPLKYDAGTMFSDGLAPVGVADRETGFKYGYIDKSGNEVIPIKYLSAGGFFLGLAAVAVGDSENDIKYGYIDKSGNVVIPFVYDGADGFREGLAAVRYGDADTGKYGYINMLGEEVIAPKYDNATAFYDGIAQVSVDGEFFYIDHSGKETEFTAFSQLDYKTFRDPEKGKWGVVDKAGNIIVPPTYDFIGSLSEGSAGFREGIAAVMVGDWETGKWGFIAITPDDPISTASEWAREEIASAIAKGFVPPDIQNNYRDVITRLEFCRMSVKFVEYVTGKDIDEILADNDVSRDLNVFADTDDPDILSAFALGITDGTRAPTATTPGLFTPDGQITRQQAARMLMNVCKVLGVDVDEAPPFGYVDIASAADWARDAINFCHDKGIMHGTGNNMFSPTATYDRQQSIVTFDRINLDEPA